MYQNIGEKKLLTDFEKLIKGVKDYNETLDTEFIKFKYLNMSGNN